MGVDHVTFFKGTTSDGIRWVLSYDGGPSATDPTSTCRVSGMIGSTKVRFLTMRQASDLRAYLPFITFAEVDQTLRQVRGLA